MSFDKEHSHAQLICAPETLWNNVSPKSLLIPRNSTQLVALRLFPMKNMDVDPEHDADSEAAVVCPGQSETSKGTQVDQA